MTQLHGPDHGKPKFMLDGDDLARVVGTALGAALAQLEDPAAQQRHQELLDAVHGLRPAEDSDAGCGLAVSECDNTYQGPGGSFYTTEDQDMREVPCEQAHPEPPESSVVTYYGPDGRLRWEVPEDHELRVRRGGVRYPTQDDAEEPAEAAPEAPQPELDDASEASRRAAGGA